MKDTTLDSCCCGTWLWHGTDKIRCVVANPEGDLALHPDAEDTDDEVLADRRQAVQDWNKNRIRTRT